MIFCEKKHLMCFLFTLSTTFFVSAAQAKDWVYTVKPGDTLWDLCLTYTTYKACWVEVGEYNGLAYPSSLAPGTRIRFPVSWLKVQPTPANVIFVVGSVQLVLANQPIRAAKVGDTLPMGALVQTGKDSSATLEFADGATLVLEPQSRVVMDLLSRHQQNGMVNTRLNLLSGAAKSRVPKREPRSNFSVSTPSAIAAVRGTNFRVSADAEQMRSEVFEGDIEVANPPQAAKRQRVALSQSFGLRVEKNKPLGKPVALLTPVVWADNVANIALPYTLAWQPLAGAERYKIELLAQSQTEEVIASDYTTESAWLLPLVQEQCFWARVSAIDGAGLQGMPAQRELCAAPALPPAQGLSIQSKKLVWQAVSKAATYRVEVSEDATFNTPVVLANTPTNTLPLTAKYKGLYIRVIPLDAQGRLGNASEAIEVSWHNTTGIIATVLLFILLAL